MPDSYRCPHFVLLFNPLSMKDVLNERRELPGAGKWLPIDVNELLAGPSKSCNRYYRSATQLTRLSSISYILL